MSLKLDWHLDGRSSDERSAAELPGEHEPAGTPVASRRRLRPASSRSALFWLIYLAALVMVGWGGFKIGHWRDLFEAHRDNLTTQLNIESRAWQTQDLELYRSTLDPLAEPAWRAVQIERFESTSPAVVTLRLLDFTTDSDARAHVRVETTRNGMTLTEERDYRLVKGSWYHSSAHTRVGQP